VTSASHSSITLTPLTNITVKDDEVIDLKSSNGYDVNRQTSTPVTSRVTDDVSGEDLCFTHGGKHLYTLLQLVTAIFGTFVGTLVLCFILIPLIMVKCMAPSIEQPNVNRCVPRYYMYSSAGDGTLMRIYTGPNAGTGARGPEPPPPRPGY
jgi:hypothetical protein